MTHFFSNKLIHFGVKTLAAFVIFASIFGPGTPMVQAEVNNLPPNQQQQANDPIGSANSAPIQQISQEQSAQNIQQIGSQQVGTGEFPAQTNTSAAAANSSINSSSGVTTGPTASQAGLALTNNGTAAVAIGGDDIGCGTGDAKGGMAFAVCVSSIVYYATVGLGSYFAYIAGYIFDYILQISLTSTAYALDFIGSGWQVVRDVANISFLFILVYIAGKVMLRAETTGTMRMLVWLVVAALLINFSFFMTRIVIDAGNILAVQFYNAIPAKTIAETSATNAPGISAVSGVVNTYTPTGGQAKDLAFTVVGALGVHSLTSSQSFKAYIQNKNGTNSAMYVVIVLSVIYIAMGAAFAILAGSFLYAAAKFGVRVVGLWFIIVSAPLAFIAAIFNKEKPAQFFNFWLSRLFAYSFYPAIYLFMFWVLALFMGEMGRTGLFSSSLFAGNVVTDWTSIGTAVAAVGVKLIFVITALYLALSVADKLAQYAEGGASWFQKTVLSGAAGGLITRPATWMASNQGFLARQARKIPGVETIGKVGSYLDVRNIKPIGAGLSGVTAGTNALKNKYGTLKADYGEARKGLLEANPYKKEAVNVKRLGEIEKTWTTDEARLKTLEAKVGPLTPVELKEKTDLQALRLERKDLTNKVGNMSSSQLTSMKAADIEAIVKNLSQSQMKAVIGSDKYSKSEVKSIETKWHETSDESALVKAEKQINLLGDIHKDLVAGGLPMNNLGSLTNYTQLAPGTSVTIDMHAAESMSKEVNVELALQQTNLRSARNQNLPPTQVAAISENVRKLNNAAKAIDVLKDKLKEVPLAVGGRVNAEEFEYKK